MGVGKKICTSGAALRGAAQRGAARGKHAFLWKVVGFRAFGRPESFGRYLGVGKKNAPAGPCHTARGKHAFLWKALRAWGFGFPLEGNGVQGFWPS